MGKLAYEAERDTNGIRERFVLMMDQLGQEPDGVSLENLDLVMIRSEFSRSACGLRPLICPVVPSEPTENVANPDARSRSSANSVVESRPPLSRIPTHTSLI